MAHFHPSPLLPRFARVLGSYVVKCKNFFSHLCIKIKAYFDAGPTAFGGFNLLGVAAAAAVGHHHGHHHPGTASFAPHEDYPYS